MAFFYSQGTAVKDYTILPILVPGKRHRYRYFQYFGQYLQLNFLISVRKYNLALNLVEKYTDQSK
jgi:hypothetical protein